MKSGINWQRSDVMEQKGIVWIAVPYSNQTESKTRPALIVSNNEYNEKNRDILICVITSNLEKKPYAIFISQKDIVEGQLPIPSKIKADKIMQVEKSLLIKQFAKISNETFDRVTKEIIKLVNG